jgi:hypothetical protein
MERIAPRLGHNNDASPQLQLLTAGLVSLASGSCAFMILVASGWGAADFAWALRAAGDLLAGYDIYRYPPGPYAIPYPLPAALVAMPFVPLRPELAAATFIGLSSGLLAWLLLRQRGHAWWLLIFVSWSYWYALIFAQWSPLIVCMAFLGPLLPLVLVKPQIALPMLVLKPPTRTGLALTVLIGLLSLLLYPTWPWVWLDQIGSYQGTRPPLLSLPLGPLLLLALLRRRDRRAWLILAMAVMPQRMVYDQLALLLVATTRRELRFMVVCSWVTLPVMLYSGGWSELPGGWQNWVILTLYLPALFVLLWPGLRPGNATSHSQL